MATYLDGNRRRATPNSRKAASRSAESRRCPKCNRKSALKFHSDADSFGSYCRWDDCDYSSIRQRSDESTQPNGDHMTDTQTTTLPTWDEMSDLDKGAVLLHLHKREYEGAGYAVENYPVKYFDDPRLTDLERRAACRHAATFGREADGLPDAEYTRLYDLALEEPDRRCLWAARDAGRVVPAETREYAVELLMVSWPKYLPNEDQSTWALLTRDEPGGEWREVPYKNVAD